MSHSTSAHGSLQGYLAEFDEPHKVVEAIYRVKDEGFVHYDSFSPYPCEEMADAMDAHRSWLPFIVLGGGITGALTGWALQWITATQVYPMNIGGRPDNSWPAFIVVIFECTILFAAFATVLGMFALNRLPQPHHPLFGVESFKRASQDRYFLYVESKDPRFDTEQTLAFMESLNASEVTAVED
jgi:Alternative complex III, ActD subunit